MKAVILTIRLKWLYLTYKGIKTIEVRKSCPKNFVGDVYEVVSKTNFEKDLMEIPESEREFFRQFKGKVGLKFTLNKGEDIEYLADDYCTETYRQKELIRRCCLTDSELNDYLNHKTGYAWHISNLVIFDKPKELSEFKIKGFERIKVMGSPYGDLLGSVAYHYEKKPILKPLTKAPQSYCFIEVEE